MLAGWSPNLAKAKIKSCLPCIFYILTRVRNATILKILVSAPLHVTQENVSRAIDVSDICLSYKADAVTNGC